MSDNAKSNYVGIAGNNDLYYNWNAFDYPGTGVFYPNSRQAMSNLVDGTSNTLMFGEIHGNSSDLGDSPASVWVGLDRPEYMNGILKSTRNHAIFKINALASVNQWNPIRSMHVGGANFSRADGSVVFVPETVAGDVYDGLGTVDGGEIVSL